MDSEKKDLEKIKKEYENILSELSNPELISDWEKMENLSKQKKVIEKILEKYDKLEEIEIRVEENKDIISSNEDPELIKLAEIEIESLKELKKQIEGEINSLIEKLKKESEDNNENYSQVIVEIRAGTGGEEAALFAADLFKMYSKYANNKKWTVKILDSRPSEIGGLKEISFEVKGTDSWKILKNEAGVHRVQRIPKTEKAGRIHTSTVSVAVLPKPKKGQILINPSEIKIDTYKASGHGGQNVNKRMTAIRITHLPTGIVVTSQNERSLQQNKENALSMLEAKLWEIKEKKEEEKIINQRREQIKGAKRSEKIRTYNFPQDRITDHRIKKSFHNIEKILEGDLDPITKALSDFNENNKTN
jgi:peptide chain release factor 1